MTVPPPIRVITRALAEMQTSILAAGLRLTGGDLDRFAILSLIVRMTADGGPTRPRAITVASVADSLSRPYESVRRHVGRLVDDGLCRRGPAGLEAVIDDGARAPVAVAWATAHAALVRFVERLAQAGVELPPMRHGGNYQPRHGVSAAVDLMLAVGDGNRDIHANWLQLVIYSVVVECDYRALLVDPALARAYRDETAMVPASLRAGVRAAAIARTLGMPETTVRRHADAMVRDGLLRRTPSGLGIVEEWLNDPRRIAVSRRSHGNVRRILDQLAARHFPFDRPAVALAGISSA